MQRFVVLLVTALVMVAATFAAEPPRAVEPRDFFLYSCVREYAKVHGFPLYDNSTGYVVEYGRLEPEEMSRLFDAAATFAKSLRAPDLKDEDHGGVAVMAQCMEEARSPRVSALLTRDRKSKD